MNAYPKSKQVGRKAVDAKEFRATHDTEKVLQGQCEMVIDLERDVIAIRIPDEVYRVIYSHPHLSEKRKGLISKYLKGVPDLILLQPLDDVYCLARCVELKQKNGKLSQGQKKFAERVPVSVVRSLDHFREVVKGMKENAEYILEAIVGYAKR